METSVCLQRDARAGGIGAPSPLQVQIDPIALALAADARHAGREAWLGVLVGIGTMALLVQGWFLPLLAAAFVSAPLIGVGLAVWDHHRQD